jgi:iron complex transport system substrate-binding protein
MITRRLASAAAIAAVAATLAACSPGTPESASPTPSDGGASSAAFPVTIEHAYGTTVIEAQPERVATVAWSNHEVPLMLGIVPVGFAAVTWGDDDGDGVLPWVEDALADLGAETPVLFDETAGIDFEAVADTQPDLILATYSGLTQEEYETLSQIAPTVAFPEVAWGTSWEDQLLIGSAALGRAEQGEALVAELTEQVQGALASTPELQGKKALFSYIAPTDLSQIGFYTIHDTRPGFLASLGLPVPAIVEEISAQTDQFYYTVSAEEADRFADVDVFITYGEPDSGFVEALQADPLLSQIPAIANGAVVILPNSTPLAAGANPSPLSIGWGINEYLALLAGPLAAG